MPVIYTMDGRYVTVAHGDDLRVRRCKDLYWRSKLVGFSGGYAEDLTRYHPTPVIEKIEDRILEVIRYSHIVNMEMELERAYREWVDEMTLDDVWQQLGRLHHRYPNMTAVEDDRLLLEIGWHGIVLVLIVLHKWMIQLSWAVPGMLPDPRSRQLLDYFLIQLDRVAYELFRRDDDLETYYEIGDEEGAPRLPDYSLN